MLGKTADGLSAYMGKSVLAEIGMDDDAEWVIFAIPLGVDETPDEKPRMCKWAVLARALSATAAGLDLDTEVYDCQYLWAVQITDDPEARFVRLDQNGDEFDYAMELAELLPFDLTDEVCPIPI
jgi:hypothetical protein